MTGIKHVDKIMDISSLLSPDLILCRHNSSSKKRILEDVAEHISEQYPDLDTNMVFSALIAREKLGSTGIGGGIAIPHCRIPQCSNTIGMLITLTNSIEFNAIDSQEVDIIFVLLVPEDAKDNHLQTLESIAETFSDNETIEQMRKANSVDELLTILKQ